MSKIVLVDSKLTPHVNFCNFQAEEIFSFSKLLGFLDEKRTATTPHYSVFLKFVQNMP